MGEIQAIGSVNEKIEGFFDVCRARGNTSANQAVIIPASSVKQLMLRAEIVREVSEGRFRIYAIKHADEGMELLTGRVAGIRAADGHFPADSINGLIEQKLRHYAELRRRYVAAPVVQKEVGDRRDG
jgi:predicted ATP-dependent protease